jgi:hypothetical protein
MKKRLSLPTRIFLLAFVSVCLVLGAGFWNLNRAMREKIKDRLKESLQSSEKILDTTASRYRKRSIQMLAVLSENPGLKAALGLLQEVPGDPDASSQVRKTIEATLFQLGRGLEYELILVADSSGRPVAGTLIRSWGTVPLDPLPASIEPSPLIEVQGVLYEASTVPINLGAENLGSLTVAREFDIASWSPTGQAVLLANQKVLRATFPPSLLPEIASHLRGECLNATQGCELTVAGEQYLALPLERPEWQDHYQLFGFQSLDTAMADFTQDFWGLFFWSGLIGTVGALLVAFAGSRSISKPMTDLILRLKTSENSGLLEAAFPTESGVEEVNLLAAALNQAAHAVQESQERLQEASLEFLETMARALDARDRYTAGHSDRVSANSTAIAQALGLPEKEVEIIRIGAKMHDIGKIGIPDAVLQKQGPLTMEEYDLIKLHPEIGKRIMEKVGQFQVYLPIVELHHEDWDGRGYPHGLSGEEVPLGARIVHVADVYDAITSDRAYRKAMPPEQVREIMLRSSGTMFEPVLVETFLSILRKRQTLNNVLEEASAPCYEQPARASSSVR